MKEVNMILRVPEDVKNSFLQYCKIHGIPFSQWVREKMAQELSLASQYNVLINRLINAPPDELPQIQKDWSEFLSKHPEYQLPEYVIKSRFS